MLLLWGFVVHAIVYCYFFAGAAFQGLIWALFGSRAATRGASIWGKGYLFLLRWCAGLHYELRGIERLPSGPVLIASKHQSIWETGAFFAFTPNVSVVFKRELSLTLHYLSAGRHIPIDREQGGRALRVLLHSAERKVAEGLSVLIFPEGTRTSPGAKADYKSGVAFLYSHLKIPCVPVALNSGLFWPRQSLFCYPGTILVEYLEPIEPGLPPREFMRQLEEKLETVCDRLVEEGARGEDAPPTVAEARERIAAREAHC